MMPASETSDAAANYDVAMQNAESRVFHLLHSLEWQLHSEKKTGSIWSMRCNVMDNYIFRYEGRIPNRTCAEVSAMIHPQGLHRNKWDSQSAGTSLVEEISHDTSVILHKTKGRMMGLISPRETLDLCRFAYDPVDGSRSVVMVSVDNEKTPKTAGVVRGQTYPTLLMINPLGDGTKITAIIQAEMFLQGVPQAIVDSLMPKGIATFFEDLIKYAAKDDNKVSLNLNLTGWCGAHIEH